MTTPLRRVLVLGGGYTGRAVALRARAEHAGLEIVVTTRSEERAAALRAERLTALVTPALGPAALPAVDASTHVVVTFPPDGATDAALAPALRPATLAYVSASSVYGSGPVDDTTPVVPTPRSAPRLAAEAAWLAAGATVLRCPAIYGPDRGLHVRIVRGEHRLPDDGARFTSRIHVDDLAALLLAARRAPGEVFVVGDLAPAPQAEVATFVAARHGVPYPPSVPLAEVHETLRADRRIDGRRALDRLGVTLTYPTYREGMAELAPGILPGV